MSDTPRGTRVELEQIASDVRAAARAIAKDAEVRVDVERLRSANVRFAKNEMTTSGEFDEVIIAVSDNLAPARSLLLEPLGEPRVVS